MMSSSKILKLARKWQKFTATRRSRISFPSVNQYAEEAETSTSTVSVAAEKGHFVVYTSDTKRFVFPLSYLNTDTFRQLLIMSEEEFGLSSDGPIVLPCTAVFMEYIISLIHRGAISAEIEKSLLTLVSNIDRFSSSIIKQHEEWSTNQGLVVC